MRQMSVVLPKELESQAFNYPNEECVMKYFSPFVIPFMIGVVALFATCAIKYIRWTRQFTRRQYNEILKNFFSIRWFKAIGEVLNESLFHIKVSKKNYVLGYMHRSIALGWFLLIFVGAIEHSFGIKGHSPMWVAIFYRYFIHSPQEHFHYAQLFANIMDTLLLYVLSGVTLAFVKSVYSRIVGMKKVTKHSLFDLFAKYSLWFIFPLRLFAESCTAALYNNGGWLTQGVAEIFTPYSASVMELPLWTFYSISLAIFFVCMPFTRYMHIFTEIPVIFLRRLGVTEGEKMTGYTKYELSACSRCGICIDNCPMNKDLGDKTVQSVYFLRDIRYKTDKLITAENCLMCGKCQAECPVGLDLMSIRRIMRDREKLDKTGNYTYLNKVNTFNAIGRVAYFGGCMSHLTPGIPEAMKKIFENVGQKYWYMDEKSTICCGRPLYQQGFIQQASELKRKNTQRIYQSGAKLLITSCPICYQSFTKEYNLPGIKVMHHSEYIAMLIKAGRLKIDKTDLKISYHDPCELGRYCNIYDEPRAVLASVGDVLKTKHERKDSLCCGHNLGNTVISWEQQTKVRDAAWENLMEVRPDVVATSCPMCKKALVNGHDFPVKDIAELVVEHAEGFSAMPILTKRLMKSKT